MTRYVLFLDDEREPSLSLLAQSPNLIVCRSYNEAVALVLTRGLPQHICFDHDLGPDSKTGHEFAKWLVDWAMKADMFDWYPVIDYSVHSQNPIGASNIRGVIDGYHRWRIETMKL